MTFPTFQSVTGTSSTSGTTHNISMPAIVNSGDLLLMFVANQGNGDTDIAQTTPSGWTLVFNKFQSSGFSESQRLNLYGRIADGTEGGTTVNVATGSSTHVTAQVWRVTGFVGATVGAAVEAGTATSASGLPSSLACPSLSPSWGSADNLWIAVLGYLPGGAVSAYPLADHNSSENNLDSQTSTCSALISTGTESPGTWTLTSAGAGLIANTVAIQGTVPASGVTEVNLERNIRGVDRGKLAGVAS